MFSREGVRALQALRLPRPTVQPLKTQDGSAGYGCSDLLDCLETLRYSFQPIAIVNATETPATSVKVCRESNECPESVVAVGIIPIVDTVIGLPRVLLVCVCRNSRR